MRRVDDIVHAYMESWKLGLKAVAIYRDGSKRTQPLNTSRDKEEKKAGTGESREPQVLRHRLPDERRSITHKFDIAGHEGYIIAGMYEDGQPGEIFITMSKEGSTISGLMDSFATAISIALQYGVPLQGIGRQVQPHALRALGIHQEPRHPDGQIDHGLYLPLAGQQVPRRRSAAGSGDSSAARFNGTDAAE